MRTNESINKAEGAGRMDAQIRFADVLRRVFPTTVASYLEFRGWIHQENLRNGISATFYLRQPLALGNGFVEAMRWPQPASLQPPLCAS